MILSIILNLKMNLHPIFFMKRQVQNEKWISYYESINLNYEIKFVDARREYSYWDCFLVLYFIQFNIQLNLKDDTQARLFLTDCGQYSMEDIQNLFSNNL
jgi:hypothetical protein